MTPEEIGKLAAKVTTCSVKVLVDDHVGDIFALPCVQGVMKNDGEIIYALRYVFDIDHSTFIDFAKVGDWLCKDKKGEWYLISKDYQEKMEVLNNLAS